MELKVYEKFTPENLATIESLESQVFKSGYQEGRFSKEAVSKTSPLVVFSYEGPVATGFKVGYQLTDDIFYSWLGGVLPSHRRKGIARALMEKQHQMAKEKGYEKVRTNGRNENREMLILNLNMGFQIIGTHFVPEEGCLSISMEKSLA